MSNAQRTMMTAIVLVGAIVLAATGDVDPAIVFGLFGTVLGYVFGDKNGEKRAERERVTAQLELIELHKALTTEADQ